MAKKNDDKEDLSKKLRKDAGGEDEIVEEEEELGEEDDDDEEEEEEEELGEEDENEEDVEEDEDDDVEEEDEEDVEDDFGDKKQKKEKKTKKTKNDDGKEQDEDEDQEDDDEEEDEDQEEDEEEEEDMEDEEGAARQQEIPPELMLDTVVVGDDIVRQKFDETFQQQVLDRHHPELVQVPWQEAQQLVKQTHATVPFLTKYERTRVLGERTEQLNSGATPLIALQQDDGVLLQDHYEIACAELVQKKLPFLIKRPLPNGEAEYWRLCDLQQL